MKGVTKIVSKSEIMQDVIKGRAHECFEHSDEGIFDVTLMREWAALYGEIHTIDVADCAPFIRQSRVTDPARIAELPMEAWLSDPVMFIEMTREVGGKSETTHLMIDGHHRMLRLEQEGVKTARAYIIPEQFAIRPQPGWGSSGVDWGEHIIVDGEIVKRG